jgi:hypothetical protein
MVGILTIIVLFKFRKGVWGNVELLFLEKYGKKRKAPIKAELSCKPDLKETP